MEKNTKAIFVEAEVEVIEILSDETIFTSGENELEEDILGLKQNN